MTMMKQQILRNWNSINILPLTLPDIDWSVFENADRYLLRDDSVWITRLSKDFWWNLERISEMVITQENSIDEIFSTRKIIGQRSSVLSSAALHIPEKFNSNSDFEYNPFQSKLLFDKNIWTNRFQQIIPWQ